MCDNMARFCAVEAAIFSITESNDSQTQAFDKRVDTRVSQTP